MNEIFDPRSSRVDFLGYLSGPTRTARVRFAVDTGASITCIRTSVLSFAGYDLSNLHRLPVKRMAAVNHIVEAPQFTVNGLFALGIERSPFPIVTYELTSLYIDGLLGIDFFRGRILTLDFHRGQISLRPPHPRWQFWR